MRDTRYDWIERLRALAREGGAPPDSGIDDARALVAGFRDEMGHRRTVDAFLLTSLLRRRGHEVAQPEESDGESGVLALWRGVLDRTGAACGSAATTPRVGTCDGPPLLARDAFRTIEVWSESLLCALHAMSWLVALAEGDALVASPGGWTRERLGREARWIIEHIEPDNATRHPWGVHVFVEIGLREGDRSAMLYAEELLHGCLVSRGRPDRLSAWILLDASDALGAG